MQKNFMIYGGLDQDITEDIKSEKIFHGGARCCIFSYFVVKKFAHNFFSLNSRARYL
jgi:hypothetical protein